MLGKDYSLVIQDGVIHKPIYRLAMCGSRRATIPNVLPRAGFRVDYLAFGETKGISTTNHAVQRRLTKIALGTE